MTIVIYFNEKPLYLTDELTAELASLKATQDVIFADSLTPENIKYVLGEMQRVRTKAGIFLHSNVEEIKNAFLNEVEVILAGGGVVLNEEQELLLIFRRGKWDLPKGKLEPNEDIATCAIREVKEETGIDDIYDSDFLTKTYHTYFEGAKLILKETHWYTIKVAGKPQLTPQIEEDILETAWVATHKLTPYLQNTYPNIREVINQLI